MNHVFFMEKYDGVAVNHLERDSDFNKPAPCYRYGYQLHYMFKGERFFLSKDGNYELKSGMTAFVDKDKIPFTNIIGGVFHDRFLFEIEEQWLQALGILYGCDFIALFKNGNGVYEYTIEEQHQIEQRLERIQAVCVGREKEILANEVIVKSELISLLIYMMEGHGRRAEEFKQPVSKMQRYSKVREIVSFVIEHCCEINSLDELADKYYLDKSYLSRNFKEVTNFTVNEFIHYQRIGHAREMIVNPDLTIAQMAEQLGYTSQSYFCRVFEKLIGVSPMQYRKMKLEKQKKDAGNCE